MTVRAAILVALGALSSASAAVSFAPVKNYPNLGFMFPRIADARAEPTPMPKAHAYLVGNGGELAYEDRFDPFELWYNNQCCARWRDGAGNRMVLGRMTRLLPSFSEQAVSRAAFGSALEDDDNRVNPARREQVNDWVATFVDAQVYEPETVHVNAFTLDEVLRYPCATTNMLVYAFRPRSVGNTKNFDWFCVTLQAVGLQDPAALQEQFEKQFIGKIAQPPRTSKDQGVEAERVSAARRGEKEPDIPDHPVRLEARKSVENYEDWWYAETEGYTILSDVDTEVGKTIIRDLQDTLPALRKAYAKLVPPLTDASDIALVRLFQSRDDYVRFVGSEQAWSGGMWMPSRRELVLYLLPGKDEMMRVIRHEAFHQYLSHAYCMLPASPWMNEGHACLFESSHVEKKDKVVIDEDDARCALVLNNMEVAVATLPFMLRSPYEGFYSGTSEVRNLKYAAAWAWVYYLQKGVPEEAGTPLKTFLADYAEALAATHDGAAATAEVLANVNLSDVQERFREFWLKRRGNARHYDPLDQ